MRPTGDCSSTGVPPRTPKHCPHRSTPCWRFSSRCRPQPRPGAAVSPRSTTTIGPPDSTLPGHDPAVIDQIRGATGQPARGDTISPIRPTALAELRITDTTQTLSDAATASGSTLTNLLGIGDVVAAYPELATGNSTTRCTSRPWPRSDTTAPAAPTASANAAREKPQRSDALPQTPSRRRRLPNHDQRLGFLSGHSGLTQRGAVSGQSRFDR